MKPRPQKKVYKHANSKHCLLGNVTNLDFCSMFSDHKGFLQLEDPIASFKKHLHSKCHAEAVEAVLILPKTRKDVGEQLSRAHQAEKEQARDKLQLILSSVCFLAGKD